MTLIEFFTGGILLIFGMVAGAVLLFMGAVFIWVSGSILGALIKVRIYWEIPIAILLMCIMWTLDTYHIEEPQTILLTGVLLTAIILVDIIMYFINIFERKYLNI